jgi:uncharacterized protein (UPF0548 family)
MDKLTYAEVGATAYEPLPRGYRYLTYRAYVGTGGLAQAADAVLSWRMHRAAGIRIPATAERAAPGVEVTGLARIGPVVIRTPSRVVWSVEEPDRAGFAYGTRAGHPFRGEESFLVERTGDGRIRFTVTAFSVPARWFARLAGPITPMIQRWYAYRCARALRRVCRPLST